jgi:hypothetical protein
MHSKATWLRIELISHVHPIRRRRLMLGAQLWSGPSLDHRVSGTRVVLMPVNSADSCIGILERGPRAAADKLTLRREGFNERSAHPGAAEGCACLRWAGQVAGEPGFNAGGIS